MIYGHDKTFRSTNLVNIETDAEGNVVAVWFRCMTLPFDQTKVDESRAEEMRRQYQEYPPAKLLAVEVEDKQE